MTGKRMWGRLGIADGRSAQDTNTNTSDSANVDVALARGDA